MTSWTDHIRPLFWRLSDKLLQKLRRKDYRDEYMDEQIRSWIARQIRVLREQRGWSQTEFARISGKPQSVISRLEDPDYGKVTLQTLLDIRAAFDVGLEVKFVDFGVALENARDLSAGAMQVDPFDAMKLATKSISTSTNDPLQFFLKKDDSDYHPPITDAATYITYANCLFFEPPQNTGFRLAPQNRGAYSPATSSKEMGGFRIRDNVERGVLNAN